MIYIVYIILLIDCPTNQVIGGGTGGRAGPKGEPGYPGSPGLKGDRGPAGKHKYTPTMTQCTRISWSHTTVN